MTIFSKPCYVCSTSLVSPPKSNIISLFQSFDLFLSLLLPLFAVVTCEARFFCGCRKCFIWIFCSVFKDGFELFGFVLSQLLLSCLLALLFIFDIQYLKTHVELPLDQTQTQIC